MCVGAVRLNHCGTVVSVVALLGAAGFLAGGLYVGLTSGWHGTAISLLVLSGVSLGIAAGSKYLQVRTYIILTDEDNIFERLRQTQKNADL